MPALVVPGVRVEARFDVLPPLPAPSGIVGIAGIVDRAPTGGELITVSKVAEIRDLLGPGTEVSMPELVHALGNGASEAVIAAVAGGSPAAVDLLNADGAPAVRMRARSNGTWGNQIIAEVRGITNAAGTPVRVGLQFLIGGRVVERFDDLRVEPGAPDDLIDNLNARSRLVVALDPGFEGVAPASGVYTFDDEGGPADVPEAAGTRALLQLNVADGTSPAGLRVEIETSADGRRSAVRVFQGGLQEQYVDLVMDPDSDRYLPYVLLKQSQRVRVRVMSSLAPAARLPAATVEPAEFEGGTSPDLAAYRAAIDRLGDDPRIDLVLASIEPTRDGAEVSQIHQALLAHSVRMADDGAPRIAFGSVTAAEQGDLARIKDHAAAVRNRRFVLVSPAGSEGYVAGMIGRLAPQVSPTFKGVPLPGKAPAAYRESELNRLLGPGLNILVVQERAERGVVVLRGIDTTGDQISVTRVADQAIRETKAIAEGFIGELNSEEARIALRQQLVATFTRLERAGALVPSTDGKDPAFVVDVYSTQLDFAQGIVRIDIAVRPARAIDYVYATIRVKN